MRVAVFAIVVLIVSADCAEGLAMWSTGGPTSHEQIVYARKGHLTRRARYNPAQTWWMMRYTERDAIHYRQAYDYRALLDYPWHVRPPHWAFGGRPLPSQVEVPSRVEVVDEVEDAELPVPDEIPGEPDASASG